MKFKLDFRRIFGAGIDRLFALGLTDPDAFSLAVRPVLEGHADGDIQRARMLALQGLKEHQHVVAAYRESFLCRLNETVSYEPLQVTIGGKRTTPVGTGPGLDAHAEGLDVFAQLFGFQTPGPVTVEPRACESAPFRDDAGWGNLCLPPRLASCGLDRFHGNLADYREQGGEAVVLAAVVGLAGPAANVVQARQEMRTLLNALHEFVDGFVWVPQMAGCPELWTADQFRRTAELMSEIASSPLKLVEMPCCDTSEGDGWLSLVDAYLSAGGDGVLAVGGQEVIRQRVPRADSWPFETALRMGRCQAECREWAIEQIRRRHPNCFIAASGGIHHGHDAVKCCAFANVIMESEAFTRYGPGLSRKMLSKLAARLAHLSKQELIRSPRLVDVQRELWNRLAQDEQFDPRAWL
jgi:hypothetical protein